MRILSILVLVLIFLPVISVADPVTTVPDARRAEDGSPFAGNALVTAAFPGYFYVQADDRACGIRVERTGRGLASGQKVVADHWRVTYGEPARTPRE